MATDLKLYIVDPASHAVVALRWLGMGGTLERAREVLQRPPHAPEAGIECWNSVTAHEIEQIAEASYAAGAKPEEVQKLALRFPAHRYLWMLVRDF